MISTLSNLWTTQAQLGRGYPHYTNSDEIRRGVHVLSAQAQRFLKEQLDGATDRLVDGERYLKARYIPQRHHIEPYSQPKMDTVKTDCALCNGNSPLVSFKSHQLRIVSNKYRYGIDSLLILADDHLVQEALPRILPDLFQLQEILGPSYSYFFNGLRGNSQRHAHVHALKEKLPIREALENGHLNGQSLGKLGDAQIHLLDGELEPNQNPGLRVAHFYGLKIQGPPSSVYPATVRGLLDIESRIEPGSYNLISWWDPHHQTTVIIIPRTLYTGRRPGICFSSSDHAGLTISTDDPCHDSYDGLKEKLLMETFRLSQMEWLKAMGSH